MNEYKLTLLNKNKEIIGYALVSKEDYGLLNKTSSIHKSSKYIGVSWNKEKNKWKSYITIEEKQKHLGYYTNEIQATQIRDIGTLKYYGEYSNINIKL